MTDPTAEHQIAELIKPEVVVAYYMSDSSTAKARYNHDGARPVILDVEDTLRAAKESGS